VKALAVGFSPVEASVTLAESKTETVTLELKPGPGGPPPPTPGGQAAGPGTAPPPGGQPAALADPSAPLRRTIGFVGIGVGGAFLVMGGVTGGLAVGKHNDLASACPNGHCPSGSQGTNQPKIDSYTLMGNLATAGLVVGGALAVTGIVLVATATGKPAASTQGLMVMPVVGPGYTGIVGEF
jgi:hypothetical protein